MLKSLGSRLLSTRFESCCLVIEGLDRLHNLTEDAQRVLYDGHSSNAKTNPNVNGSLIAVSYEARAKNVKRNDRGLEAIKKAPTELVIIQVPVLHGKANLSIYRDASDRLMSQLLDSMKKASSYLYENLSGTSDTSLIKSIPLEKASVDEVYVDISSCVQKILELCK